MKKLILFAGPNGAGKTTAAEMLIPQMDDMNEFVNADKIAAGLSPYNVESQSIAAGRLMLKRIHDLIDKQSNLIFESTLATKGFTKILKQAKQDGYHTSLIYLWLPNAAFAKKRVAHRVSKGGHNIPNKDVERRYSRSIENLKNLYWDYFDQIKIYDGSQTPPDLIAIKNGDLKIFSDEIWDKINS